MSLRVVEVTDEVIAGIPYLNAAARGGVEVESLLLVRATVEGLPDELAGLLVTSDLQGRAASPLRGGESCLLGEVLAETCLDLAADGLIPTAPELGVLLCGDLYAAEHADQRGATGDVRPVWSAFGHAFRWVIGVAGNHDEFGNERQAERFLGSLPDASLLDGDVVERDGLSFGGVGLIIGNTRRSGRRSEESFLGLLEPVVAAAPDVLLLHEGPALSRRQRGSEAITELLVESDVPLVTCGHVHWDEPLGELTDETQVLNVDARALLLTPADR
ncbi:MAG: metallophosphoesterase [Acidobacteriota bacterium]